MNLNYRLWNHYSPDWFVRLFQVRFWTFLATLMKQPPGRKDWYLIRFLYNYSSLESDRHPLFCHNYWCIYVPLQAKLSQLCEQDKVVRNQEEKLQQLHREKVTNISLLSVSQCAVPPVSLVRVCLQHTLETALLSASQEIEMSAENPVAVQSVIQQRDVLQSGLLSTCREVSRVNTVRPSFRLLWSMQCYTLSVTHS